MACQLLLLLAAIAVVVTSKCFEPSPAFPVPQWQKSGPWISHSTFSAIEKQIYDGLSQKQLGGSSFSIEVTSADETLWTNYHTAKLRNEERPGVAEVDGDSQYRIASITKTFTTLGLLYQHAAGNLSLDDPVSDYIPELDGSDSGGIPWKHITLRTLASQLSGIPRDFRVALGLDGISDPTTIGFPPSRADLPEPCPAVPNNGSCTRSDLFRALKQYPPVFAPNQKSTYSNIAFELLGLALENTTGVNYSAYIQQAILDPLKMAFTSLEKPSDDHAVLPVGKNWWDVEQGVRRPTGGIYSSATDLSKFLRYVLKSHNSVAAGVNWFLPASWSTGMESFFGMPWEILRSDRILAHSKRPVTFVTKGGGLPGYFSQIALLPEFGLGVTVLVAGSLSVVESVQNVLLPALVNEAEAATWQHVADTYTGDFEAADPELNSSLTISSSAKNGLTLSHFISNGTDILNTVIPHYLCPELASSGRRWNAQLTPTLLFKNESTRQGEIWRMMVVEERGSQEENLFSEFCTTDVDTISYAQEPLNEVVFWHEQGKVELPAFEVVFEAVEGGGERQSVVPSLVGRLMQQVFG